MADADYDSTPNTGKAGTTPALRNWSYGSLQDKHRIKLFDDAAKVPAICPVIADNATTGIDAYGHTVLHERVHVKQVQQADNSVSGGRIWMNGWAWDKKQNARGPTHNHWSMGSDGKPGLPGFDDDANGVVDDFPADPSNNLAGQKNYEFDAIFDPVTQQANRLSPDIPLNWTIEDSTMGDWPRRWGAPPCTATCCENNAIEHQAFMETVTHDNDSALDAKDGSDPGTPHANHTPGSFRE